MGKHHHHHDHDDVDHEFREEITEETLETSRKGRKHKRSAARMWWIILGIAVIFILVVWLICPMLKGLFGSSQRHSGHGHGDDEHEHDSHSGHGHGRDGDASCLWPKQKREEKSCRLKKTHNHCCASTAFNAYSTEAAEYVDGAILILNHVTENHEDDFVLNNDTDGQRVQVKEAGLYKCVVTVSTVNTSEEEVAPPRGFYLEQTGVTIVKGSLTMLQSNNGTLDTTLNLKCNDIVRVRAAGILSLSDSPFTIVGQTTPLVSANNVTFSLVKILDEEKPSSSSE